MVKVLFGANLLNERCGKIMANNGNRWFQWVKDNILTILGWSGVIIIGIWTLYSNAITLPDEMKDVKKQIEEHATESQTEIDGIEDTVSGLTTQIASLTSSINAMNINISDMNSRLNNYEKVVFNSAISVALSSKTSSEMKIESVDEQNAIFLNMKKIDSNIQNMAVDLNTGREYTSDDLINQNIFFTYTEDEQQILFLGKYDKNGAWDDRCLLNVYQDDKLVSIMDAMYENGILTSYTQVMRDFDDGEEIWLKSARTIAENGVKTGETWKYKKNKDVNMTFKFEQAINTDIISIYQFEEEQNLILSSYYSGNTANGKYNDLTGNAYLISYFDDGTVHTLYQGNFKDGLYNDTTGNAWYITKEINTDYMYYKGHYGQGRTLNNEGYIYENPITIERIEEIISGKTFNCELKWLEQL